MINYFSVKSFLEDIAFVKGRFHQWRRSRSEESSRDLDRPKNRCYVFSDKYQCRFWHLKSIIVGLKNAPTIIIESFASFKVYFLLFLHVDFILSLKFLNWFLHPRREDEFAGFAHASRETCIAVVKRKIKKALFIVFATLQCFESAFRSKIF